MVKKWFLSLSIIFLIFGFTGCSQGEETQPDDPADKQEDGDGDGGSNDDSNDEGKEEPAEDSGDNPDGDNLSGDDSVEDDEEETAEPGGGDGPSGQDPPQGFPEDFPVPNDAVISATSTISDENYNYMTFIFETYTAGSELLTLYKEYMEANGFTNVYEISSNDGSMMGGEIESDGSSILVSFGPNSEGGNEVSIIYNRAK